MFEFISMMFLVFATLFLLLCIYHGIQGICLGMLGCLLVSMCPSSSSFFQILSMYSYLYNIIYTDLSKFGHDF